MKLQNNIRRIVQELVDEYGIYNTIKFILSEVGSIKIWMRMYRDNTDVRFN